MKENIKGANREILAEYLPRMAYKINISEKSQEKISDISKFLEENREVNFIAYFNHISYTDPILAGHIVNKIDAKKTRHIVAPISYSHTESKTKNSTLKVMRSLGDWAGVETVRIIQKYQVNNDKYGYTQDQAQATYKKLINRIEELKENKIPTGFLISPEGTRSENGSLENAEKGMLLVGKILEPVLFIPIGIYYDGEYKRNGVNLGKSLNLEIGEYYLYEKGKDRKDIDFYMKNLAEVLPEKMRGKWAEMPQVRK